MTQREFYKTVKAGIYRLHWKSGGSSLAAVGILHDGRHWIAPTNWANKSEKNVTFAGDNSKYIRSIKRVEEMHLNHGIK